MDPIHTLRWSQASADFDLSDFSLILHVSPHVQAGGVSPAVVRALDLVVSPVALLSLLNDDDIEDHLHRVRAIYMYMMPCL